MVPEFPVVEPVAARDRGDRLQGRGVRLQRHLEQLLLPGTCAPAKRKLHGGGDETAVAKRLQTARPVTTQPLADQRRVKTRQAGNPLATETLLVKGNRPLLRNPS